LTAVKSSRSIHTLKRRLKKYVLRWKKILCFIKCLNEENFSDVKHFNTLLHIWQLIIKHVDNNGKKMVYHRKKLVTLIPCVKFMGLLILSKDALREKETPCLIKCTGEENLSDVRCFNHENEVIFQWSTTFSLHIRILKFLLF
jgi:hypothetical protein